MPRCRRRGGSARRSRTGRRPSSPGPRGLTVPEKLAPVVLVAAGLPGTAAGLAGGGGGGGGALDQLVRADVALAARRLRPRHAALIDRQRLAGDVGARSRVDRRAAGQQRLRVGVGPPPLFWSGPRCGSVFTRSPVALNPQVFALSRLKPAEANVPPPAQLPAGVAVLPATIVSLNWTWPRFEDRAPGRVGVVARDREVADQRVAEAEMAPPPLSVPPARDRHRVPGERAGQVDAARRPRRGPRRRRRHPRCR